MGPIGVVAVLAMATSGIASWALVIVWPLNGFFLWLFMRGRLRLPHVLERVHSIEPVLYSWLGVRLIKRIVATPLWRMVNGFDPPPKATSQQEFLGRTEQTARGAEICHLATFACASLVMAIYLATGNISAAIWILAFNLLLNGYPVMLQRVHRWRIQQIRIESRQESQSDARTSID
jgi:Glycosyl-4,4'-diaponeurosporenoate acyltransferase